MFKELYNDDQIIAVGVVEDSELTGLIVTFKSLLARRTYYKMNTKMFVYKGRWFQGEIEKDNENVLYINIEHYGYLLLENDNLYFREIRDIERL